MPDGSGSGDGLQGQILLALKDDVSAIKTDVAVIKRDVATVTDHEQRIRALEKARWPLPTVASLAAVAAAVAAWLTYAHHH